MHAPGLIQREFDRTKEPSAAEREPRAREHGRGRVGCRRTKSTDDRVAARGEVLVANHEQDCVGAGRPVQSLAAHHEQEHREREERQDGVERDGTRVAVRLGVGQVHDGTPDAACDGAHAHTECVNGESLSVRGHGSVSMLVALGAPKRRARDLDLLEAVGAEESRQGECVIGHERVKRDSHSGRDVTGRIAHPTHDAGELQRVPARHADDRHHHARFNRQGRVGEDERTAKSEVLGEPFDLA